MNIFDKIFSSTSKPKSEENECDVENLQLSLQRRADDCGLLMVELEAKSSVFNQALESSQEAIESFDKMKIDESSLDPTTRAVLDNLKDRKTETESEWQKLQKNVNEQKNKIYKKLDGLSKVF